VKNNVLNMIEVDMDIKDEEFVKKIAGIIEKYIEKQASHKSPSEIIDVISSLSQKDRVNTAKLYHNKLVSDPDRNDLPLLMSLRFMVALELVHPGVCLGIIDRLCEEYVGVMMKSVVAGKIVVRGGGEC